METPQLAKLMSTYFNQDFEVIYGSSEETVDAFLDDHPRVHAELLRELRAALAAHPDERRLEAYLDGMGCEYAAHPAEGGYQGWLTSVTARVEARLADRAADGGGSQSPGD